MNYYLHGGRVGDIVYSLYAVKKIWEMDKQKKQIYQICLYHWPASWGQGLLDSISKLVAYQPYIDEVRHVKIPWRWRKVNNSTVADVGCDFHMVTHDLIGADTIRNPEKFPEAEPDEWPGCVHLSKRYASKFNIPWLPETRWLDAPSTKSVDVVIHAPKRRMEREFQWWRDLVLDLSDRCRIKIVTGANDVDEWLSWNGFARFVITPANFLETADWIQSARVFLGVASSCNTIAEGLKKRRFVETRSDCFNTYPYGETGCNITRWSKDRIIDEVMMCL